MEQHCNIFDVALMCRVLQTSRSGYYDWRGRDPSERSKRRYDIQRLIESIFWKSDKSYGSPRIYKALKAMGIKISKPTVGRWMKEMGLRSKVKRKYKATTQSDHKMPVSPNHLLQDFSAQKPNQIWLSDITYVQTGEGWLYLASVLDLFSRKIVGWSLSESLSKQFVLDALEMAVKRQNPDEHLIFHSDRGSQYACKEFRARISFYSMIQSMSRRGNCWDNGVPRINYQGGAA